MAMNRITAGVAAAALVTVGAFALAPSAGAATSARTCATGERWPASAEGRPAAHTDADAVYVWHTRAGWRVRVNDPHVDRAVFTGSVRVDGAIVGVGRHLERGAEGVLRRAKGVVDFRFVNHGGVDGLNFVTKCSTTVTVNVKRNGVTVDPTHVYVGESGANPAAVPFTISRAA